MSRRNIRILQKLTQSFVLFSFRACVFGAGIRDEDETPVAPPTRVESQHHREEKRSSPRGQTDDLGCVSSLLLNITGFSVDITSLSLILVDRAVSRRPSQAKHASQPSGSSSPVVKRSLSTSNPSTPTAPPLPEREESLASIKQHVGLQKTPFLLLSQVCSTTIFNLNAVALSAYRCQFSNFLQDEFKEHKVMVTNCKFNAPGSLVASCDSENTLKVWSCTPVV